MNSIFKISKKSAKNQQKQQKTLKKYIQYVHYFTVSGVAGNSVPLSTLMSKSLTKQCRLLGLGWVAVG